MSIYSDYLRRKSHDAIKFGYSDEYPCIAENSKGKDLKSYKICGNSIQQNKNILPFPYASTVHNEAQIINNGVTFTNNGDGSITVNGTATAFTKFYLTQSNQKYSVPRGRYWVSGCPSGGSRGTYYQVFEWYKDNVWINAVNEYGSGTFVNTYTENYDSYAYSIRIEAGTTVNNLIFKPMLMSLDEAENLIAYPFYNTTITKNGVTFTDNIVTPGNVTISGTATQSSYFCINSNYTGSKSKYFLFGCQSGGSSTTYGLHINLRRREENNSVTYVAGFNDYGSGTIADLSQYDYTQCEVVIAARKDATINNAVITPKMVDISYISQVPSFNNPIPIKSVGTKTKNVLPYPFATSTSTLNGITITDKGNGTLVLNGTASKFTAIQVVNSESFNLTPGKYWFSGCPSGGGSANYYMYLSVQKNTEDSGWQIVKEFTEIGNGLLVDLTNLDYTGIYVSIGIKKGVTVTDLEFKPFVMSIDDAENLIPLLHTPNITKLGITITNNRNNTITFNGTNTGDSDAYFGSGYRFNIPKGSYFYTGCPAGGAGNTYISYFEIYKINNKINVFPEYGSGTRIDLRNYDYNNCMLEFSIAKGNTVTDLTWKPCLISIDYEPPEMYKIPIVIKGNNEIKFPYYNSYCLPGTYIDHGIKFTINNDGTVIANGTNDGVVESQIFFQRVVEEPLRINPHKSHYLTGCPLGGSDSTYFMQILTYRGSAYFGSARDYGSGARIPVYNIPYDGVIIKIQITKNVTVNNLVFKPMLVEGDNPPSKFEPYYEPIIKNIWVKEPLRKISSTVYDMIDFKKSRVNRNVGNTIINGSEDWKVLTGTHVTKDNVRTVISNLQFSQYSKSLIDTGRYVRGLYSSGTYQGYTSWSSASQELMYRKDNITPDEMKQLLQAYPSEVISQLKSSTTESIEVPKLPSFKGTTIYETDTEVAPSNIKSKYIRK